MERCDFSSVIAIIKQYVSDHDGWSQLDLLYKLFNRFLQAEDARDFDFDNGLVSKWMSGQANISPHIRAYYNDPEHKVHLMQDIEEHILPLAHDRSMAEQELHDLVSGDISISGQKKEELLRSYPPKTVADESRHIADILCFAMERTFIKRDPKTKKLLSSRSLSPVLQDYVLESAIPKPCRNFCGRDQELEGLHAQLTKKSKVFLYGIAGIGKSELAKAYARQYRKDYSNILHLLYPDDLKQMIADMDCVDDLPSDTDDERFRKHNRFLRTLKDDTLLIIDNFNTTGTKDSVLPVVLKYNCRILFTTRSQFEQGSTFELTEIADKDVLQSLVAKFYTKAEQQADLVAQIIDTVHSHTLAVELAARLLENGILEPQALLAKLQAERAALSTDQIGIQKDGQVQKATYYGHIHTLFSLYALAVEEQDVMRCLSLIPLSGIRARLFGVWLELRNLDEINELAEMGLIQMHSGTIALHPMVQEISVVDTRPSIRNCRTMLDSLQSICIMHGKDISYHRVLFQTVENIIRLTEKDDVATYLLFLEDVFPYMEKYQYRSGMEAVLEEMTQLLEDDTVGASKDRALLLDFRATVEEQLRHNLNKAIHHEKAAVEMLEDITPENAHLAANLNANLGGLYCRANKLDLAKKHMEFGMQILKEHHLLCFHDTVPVICNYASLLSAMGELDQALAVLEKCAYIVEEYNSDQCIDYAVVQENIGVLYLQTLDLAEARQHFEKALTIYKVHYESEPDVMEACKNRITLHYPQAGIDIGKMIIGK